MGSKKSALAQAITRGRVAAGSMTKLVSALAVDGLGARTLQEWEQERMKPPPYVAALVIERINRFLCQ